MQEHSTQKLYSVIRFLFFGKVVAGSYLSDILIQILVKLTLIQCCIFYSLNVSGGMKMSFTAHLEYLFHITCSECKFYWTYASMIKNFDIERRDFHCPNCGQKNRIKLEGEVNG